MLSRLFKKATSALLVGLLLISQVPLDALARGARGLEVLPAAAVAAGYTERSLGPAVTLGSKLYNFNFAGVTPIAGQSVQNPDGSVTLPITDGSHFGAGLGTATKVGSSWTGIMFNGGWFAEAVIKFDVSTCCAGGFPFPAFWMQSEDWLLGHTNQWPGLTPPNDHRVEFDIMQWPHNSPLFWLGPELDDWFGPAFANSIQSVSSVAASNTSGAFTCTIPGGHTLAVGAYVTIVGPIPTYPAAGGISGYVNPSYYKISATNGTTTFTLTTLGGAAITTAVGAFGSSGFVEVNSVSQPDPHLGAEIKVSQNAALPTINMSDYNRYGVLYIPATAITPGSITAYFNGVPVPYAAGASQITWTQYSAANGPPPQYGTSAGSLLDNSLMMFIFGTDVTAPMTIQRFSVWQKPINGNVVHFQSTQVDERNITSSLRTAANDDDYSIRRAA